MYDYIADELKTRAEMKQGGIDRSSVGAYTVAIMNMPIEVNRIRDDSNGRYIVSSGYMVIEALAFRPGGDHLRLYMELAGSADMVWASNDGNQADKLLWDPTEAVRARMQVGMDDIMKAAWYLIRDYCGVPQQVDPAVEVIQSPSAPNSEKAANALWEEAKQAYQAGDLNKAGEKAKASIQLLSKPDRVEFAGNLEKANALWKQGQDLYKKKDLPGTLAQCEQSIKLAGSPARNDFVKKLREQIQGQGQTTVAAGKPASGQGAAEVPKRAPDSATSTAPSPPGSIAGLSPEKRQGFFDCLCSHSPGAGSAGVWNFYSDKPVDDSEHTRDVSNGYCVKRGLGSMRYPLDPSPEGLRMCLISVGLDPDKDYTEELKRYGLKSDKGSGGTQSKQPDNSAAADGLWEEAKQAYESGDLNKAEEKAKASIQLLSKPDRVEFAGNLEKANALWKKGQDLYKKKDLPGTLAQCEESITLAGSPARIDFVKKLRDQLRGSYPLLAGKWEGYQNNKKVAECEILQEGGKLTFIITDRTPQPRSTGTFVTSGAVVATDWSSAKAVLRDGAKRLDWGDSEWVRPGTKPTGVGPGSKKQENGPSSAGEETPQDPVIPPVNGDAPGGKAGSGGGAGDGSGAWVLVGVKDWPPEKTTSTLEIHSWKCIYERGQMSYAHTIGSPGKSGGSRFSLEVGIESDIPTRVAAGEVISVTYSYSAVSAGSDLIGATIIVKFDDPDITPGYGRSQVSLRDAKGKKDLFLGNEPPYRGGRMQGDGRRTVSGMLSPAKPLPEPGARRSLYAYVSNGANYTFGTEYIYEWQGKAKDGEDDNSSKPPEPPPPPPPPEPPSPPGPPQFKDPEITPETGVGGITGDSNTLPEVMVDPPSADKQRSSPVPVPQGMIIRADERTANPGDTVLIPVYLQRGQGVANMNFTISYDARVARAEGQIVKGNLIDANTSFEANPGETGVARVGFARSSDLKNFDGTLANIPFKVTGQPGDRTALSVSVLTINGADGRQPEIATVHGAIIVAAKKDTLQGSTTGNKTLTPADALNALKMSVKLISEDLRADMNQDNKVMSDDARLILQKVVGK
jgi:exonuclease VII small subunit